MSTTRSPGPRDVALAVVLACPDLAGQLEDDRRIVAFDRPALEGHVVVAPENEVLKRPSGADPRPHEAAPATDVSRGVLDQIGDRRIAHGGESTGTRSGAQRLLTTTAGISVRAREHLRARPPGADVDVPPARQLGPAVA